METGVFPRQGDRGFAKIMTKIYDIPDVLAYLDNRANVTLFSSYNNYCIECPVARVVQEDTGNYRIGYTGGTKVFYAGDVIAEVTPRLSRAIRKFDVVCGFAHSDENYDVLDRLTGAQVASILRR